MTRVPGRAGDPTPVRVATVHRGLDQRARRDRAGDGARIGVVGGTRDLDREERRCALAIGGLLPREVAGDRFDRPTQHVGGGRREPDRRPAQRAGGEHEHRVVGRGIPVDRELVPGPRVIGRMRRDNVSGSMVASVVMTESIVAIRGWIIPTPLAMPDTRTCTVRWPSAWGIANDVVATLVTESVVRSASAAASSASSVVASVPATASMPALTRSTGSRVPMIPVERHSTFSGSTPSRIAVAIEIES